jgi:hypothetical protein
MNSQTYFEKNYYFIRPYSMSYADIISLAIGHQLETEEPLSAEIENKEQAALH